MREFRETSAKHPEKQNSFHREKPVRARAVLSYVTLRHAVSKADEFQIKRPNAPISTILFRIVHPIEASAYVLHHNRPCTYYLQTETSCAARIRLQVGAVGVKLKTLRNWAITLD